jgi:hypothetical protein
MNRTIPSGQHTHRSYAAHVVESKYYVTVQCYNVSKLKKTRRASVVTVSSVRDIDAL